MTSTITLDATVNPDFSQVESDAFQVEVNQRFPIFFGEKRPFFMEGTGIFALAGAGGDNSLRTAVHTRRIVDPGVGAKLTGSVGRITFGTLSAIDNVVPGIDDAVPDAGDEGLSTANRRLYADHRAPDPGFGSSNYVGALATDVSVSGGGGYNRVVGGDLRWRMTPAQRLEGFGLVSRTQAPDRMADDRTSVARGAQLNYSYQTLPWGVTASAKHYDPDFEMATAFISRVGITSGWAYVERNFYPDKARYPWIRRVALLSFTQGGRDRLAGGEDLLEVAGARFNFSRQGFLRVDRSWVRTVAGPTIHARADPRFRQRPAVSLALPRGVGIGRARGLLRPGRSISWPVLRAQGRGDAPAQRTPLAGAWLQPRRIRPRTHRGPGVHSRYREHQDDLSIHPGALGPRHCTIRQLPQPGAAESPPAGPSLEPGTVVYSGLRLAHRATRVRGWTLDSRRGGVRNQPPRSVPSRQRISTASEPNPRVATGFRRSNPRLNALR